MRAALRRWRIALAVLPAFLAAGCSGAELLNAAAPRAGIQVTSGIAYGEGPRRTLDIYAPRDAADAPVAVFFYGGGWESGTKEEYRFAASALAERGIVVVVPDYRLYPQVRFPAFLQDAAQAVRWTRDHAGAYGGDPSRLVLAGHSAGAYIAAMLALDRRWLSAAGVPASAIAGTVGLAGPYDFLPLREPNLKAIFGRGEALARTQPIHFVDGRAAPMLLAAGKADLRVDPGDSVRLAERIRAKGGAAELILYPGIDHKLIVGALARPLTGLAPVLDDVTGFIKARHAGAQR
ncbi:MAG TPA: alpha/beta hydrolase [Xanthobacteraceae bacterium]|nr:alpha/beta hydrolase [Xanthobacteraceae bacterium]